MPAAKQKFRVLSSFVPLTLAVLFSTTIYAAPAGFFRIFGEASRDIGNDVVQLADGGYVVVGNTLSFSAGNFDVLVIRLDENGAPLWQRTFGGADHEAAFSVIASGDGGVVFTAFIGAGSFGGAAQDAWVMRLDAAGGIVWQKIFTGPGFDQIREVRLLPDGSFILAGFISPGFSPLDLWLARIDAAGATLWEKVYQAAATGLGMTVAADGNVLVTGITDDSPSDLLLTKIDADNGAVLWAKRYGGSGSDRGNDLVELPDGGIVVSGSTASFGLADNDAWVIRTDSSGELEWQVSFGATGSDSASGIGTIDGQVVIAGTNDFNSTSGSNFGWMARLDARSGAGIWRRAVGGMDGRNTGLGLDITLDGGAVSVGTVNSGTMAPFLGDIYVAKVNSIGTVLSCPVTEDTPFVTVTTSAIVNSLVLTGIDVVLGEIASGAVPSNAPINNTLICLADPLIFLADLEDLVFSLSLPKGLTAKLDDAVRVLADGNPNNDHVAINKLEDFIKQVDSQRGKRITDAEADELIAVAGQIIDFLQNS